MMALASKATIVVTMMASGPEAEHDARTVAIIGVAAMAATVAITTMAVTVAAIVHGFGELLRNAYAMRDTGAAITALPNKLAEKARASAAIVFLIFI